MDWIKLILESSVVSTIIGVTIPAFAAYWFFRKRTMWQLKYDILVQALKDLEKLKYISWQHSRINDELTDICLPSTKQNADYLNENILVTIESLIGLKILFKNKLYHCTESYEKKISEHFHQGFWDNQNEYPGSHDEFDNYMIGMELYQRRSLRIHKTTKAFIRLIEQKNLLR